MIDIKSIFTTIFNNIIELKNTKADISDVQEMHNTDKSFEYVLTKGANYSSVELLYDIGYVNNILRIGFKATRESATSTGNIAQDEVFTIKIYTRDLFTTLHNVNLINYTAGALHNFSTGYRTYGSDEKGAYVEFSLQMNATHTGVTSTNGVLIMLADLNTAKYWG